MKVLKPFTCKVTKKRYEIGSVYDGDRGAELAEKGFIEYKEKAEVSHTPKMEIEVEPTKKRTRRK